MNHRLERIGLMALALCCISMAPRSAAAATALGTSTWSLEVASDLGSGDDDISFAIRRHSGATSALRFGVQMNADELDGDGALMITGNPDENVELLSASEAFTFSVQWMRFAAIRDNVTGTFAIGPVLRKQRNYGRQSLRVGLPTFSEGEAWEKSTSYGLELGLGMEWFLSSRISLGGQTGVRATIGTGSRVQIGRDGAGATAQKTETNMETDVKELTTSTARLQLAVYF